MFPDSLLVKMCVRAIFQLVFDWLSGVYTRFENEASYELEPYRRRRSSVKHLRDTEQSCQSNVCFYGNQSFSNHCNHALQDRRASQCSVYAICTYDWDYYYTNPQFNDLEPFDLEKCKSQGQWQETCQLLNESK